MSKNKLLLSTISSPNIEIYIDRKDLDIFKITSYEHRYHGSYYTIDKVIYEGVGIMGKVPHIFSKKELIRINNYNNTIYEIKPGFKHLNLIPRDVIRSSYSKIPPENSIYIEL